MPLEKEQLDPDELETITMHKILETTTFFQRAVYLVSSVSRLILKENVLKNLTYGMVTRVQNIELYIQKLLRKKILEVLIIRKIL